MQICWKRLRLWRPHIKPLRPRAILLHRRAEEKVDLHYVCFVKSEKSGHLFEMDGRRIGPLDRGDLAPDEDVLSPEALQKGVKAFLKREEQAGGGDLRFSLIALAEGFD